ncbi:hypothetical protein [Deinococcus peraridilitoris]|nr:hypothetical protein [Deinococcus peraridilitoris]
MISFPRLSRLLPTLLCGGLLSLALAQGDLRARLLAFMPDNGQVAEVMVWTPDPQIMAIKERIRQASQQDPRWFREYAAEHGADSPPWHPKFGVSEGEYQRSLSPDWVRLERTGKTVRLLVVKTGNRVTFQGGVGAEALRGLSLDVASGELRTAEGFTARPRTVNVAAKDDHLGLGARRGWSWQIEDVNLRTRTAVIANLGLQQLSNGGVLLAYNRGSTVDGKRQPEVSLALIYDKKVDVSKR